MNGLSISFKNIRHRPLATFLSVLLLAFGVGIISLLMSASKQIEDQFTKNIAGIDMVVGAKGSPLQLILSSVYQIDAPTGNIPLAEYRKLIKNPMVEEGIPLAYGDNYEGYRIVGTEISYLEHYDLEFREGSVWKREGDVVIGARVAELTGLGMGEEFQGSHGLTSDMDTHAFTYRVSGILEPSGTVADKLILSNIQSVWSVHSEHGEEEHGSADKHAGHEEGEDIHTHEEEHQEEESSREITAAFIKFRNAMGNIMLPRMVNQGTPMQAALPAIEINRLFALMGSGIRTLRALAILIVVISGISVFISLYQSLQERKYELALMRSMGASRLQLFGLLCTEGLLISAIGYISGLLLGKAGLYVISGFADEAYRYSLQIPVITTEELIMFPIILAVGFLASLLPSVQAFRLNISKTLSDA